MQISGKGAVVGAAVGAVARSAVVFINLGSEVSPVFLLPSATIGLLVGGIAGSTGRPLLGTLVGAILSAGVFEIIMLPCLSLVGTVGDTFGNRDAEGKFLVVTLFWALQMGLAGALAGGVGGYVGRAKGGPPPPTNPSHQFSIKN